jgi:hypothetical protein
MTTITIKLEAPELAAAIFELANRLGSVPAPAKPAPTEPAPIEPSVRTVSLEAVRAKLTQLSEAGKKADLKDLFSQFGITKLTDLPKEKLPELLEAVEGKL